MMLVKIPIESSKESAGCREAGNAVISQIPANYSNETGKNFSKFDLNIEEIHLDNSKLKQAHALIYENSIELIETNKKVVFLGGDHSLTFSTALAFKEVCDNENKQNREDKEPFLIIFDAHADCEEYSGIPNSRQWLRALIEKGFNAEKIILAGFRPGDSEEIAFLKSAGARIYAMKDMNDFEELCDIIMELARENNIYLSIDIDAADAVFVPGTAHPESAGLTSRQLVYFVQRISMLKNLRVVDITEINPKKDIKEATVKFRAKIAIEVLN